MTGLRIVQPAANNPHKVNEKAIKTYLFIVNSYLSNTSFLVLPGLSESRIK
jgi:hypothetical protein